MFTHYHYVQICVWYLFILIRVFYYFESYIFTLWVYIFWILNLLNIQKNFSFSVCFAFMKIFYISVNIYAWLHNVTVLHSKQNATIIFPTSTGFFFASEFCLHSHSSNLIYDSIFEFAYIKYSVSLVLLLYEWD